MAGLGPWVSLELDEEYARESCWKVGDVIESYAYDDDGKAQGRTLMVVVAPGGKSRLLLASVMAIEDGYYAHWFFEDKGHPNPGLYRVVSGKGDDQDLSYRGKPVLLARKWRVLNPEMAVPDLGRLGWLSTGEAVKVSHRIEGVLSNLEAEAQASAKVDGGPNPTGGGDVLVGNGARTSRAPGGVAEDLDELRRSLERGRSPKRGSQQVTLKPGARGADESTLVEERCQRLRTEASKRGGFTSDPLEGSRRAERPRSEPRHSRSRSARRSRSRRARSASRSASVFRLASSSAGRSSQERLTAWATRYPGRLASRSLQKMEDLVGRDGEAARWGADDTPAAAKSYYWRVVKVAQNPGLRNLREMHTICAALDHMALGRTKHAADVLAQRLKALEVAASEGCWDRAQFLELIPNESVTLTDKDEQHMMARESDLRARLTRNSASYDNGWQRPDKGKGKGKDYKGKESKDKRNEDRDRDRRR